MFKELKSSFPALISNLLLGFLIATPNPTYAQPRQVKLGNYDESSGIFTCNEGNFQVRFPFRPKETIEKTIKNEIPAFAGYTFGDEKGLGVSFSGNEAGFAVLFSESTKLQSANASEHRRLADAFFASFNPQTDIKPPVVRKREVKVPGASFAMDYISAREVEPSDFEEGGLRELQMRVIIAQKTFYAIIAFGTRDISKRNSESPNPLAESFRFLNLPNNKVPGKRENDSKSPGKGY